MLAERGVGITAADEDIGIEPVDGNRLLVLHDGLLVLTQAVIGLTQAAMGSRIALCDLSRRAAREPCRAIRDEKATHQSGGQLPHRDSTGEAAQGILVST